MWVRTDAQDRIHGHRLPEWHDHADRSATVVTLTLGGTAGSSDYTVNTALGQHHDPRERDERDG